MTDDRSLSDSRIVNHLQAIRTPWQAKFINEWCYDNNANWSVVWDSKPGTVKMRIYPGAYTWLIEFPFDESSTTEDVDKLIELLKVAEVHGS